MSPAAKAPPKGTDDPRMPAAVDLIGRSGAHEFAIRYCEEVEPTVWIAQSRHGRAWTVAVALTPLGAVFNLCDDLIDGGQCQHCGRPTGFEPTTDPMPMPEHVCWYQWDPELATFRRGCAGDAP